MVVEVRLFAGFREGRFKRQAMELPEGACLRDVLGRLAIPEKEVSLPLVNGRHSPFDRALADDDVVALFPAIGGG